MAGAKNNKIERRTFTGHKVEMRTDGDNSILDGHGAVFYDGTPATEYILSQSYKWKERVSPNAFNRALDEHDDVRGLFNHDVNFILGRTMSGTMDLSVDKKGLRYEITLPETQQAADVATSVKRGDITGSSFSFWPTKTSWEEGEDGWEIRTIEEVILLDLGPVTFPAYDGATSFARAEERSALQAIKEERDEFLQIKDEKETNNATNLDIINVRMRMIELDLMQK